MMQTHCDQGVVLCWHTEEPGRWILGRRTLTYQSGWLSLRQVREPVQSARASFSGLLRQVWTLRPRPVASRHLRAYTHLPPLRWLSDRAWAMALRGHDHSSAARLPVTLHGSLPGNSSPVYRHPHARRDGPVLPGCVVVVDVPVTHGCPIFAWPPPDALPHARSDARYFQGALLFWWSPWYVWRLSWSTLLAATVGCSPTFCGMWTSLRGPLVPSALACSPLSRLWALAERCPPWACCEPAPRAAPPRELAS